jgi:putative MATE family efflux protein
VITAKYFGAKDKNSLKKTIHTAIAVSFSIGAVFMVIGLTAAPTLLKLLDTPQEIFDTAVVYIRIYFLSFISIVSYNIGSGLLRALGDSRSPVLHQLIGGIFNVIANAFFIWILGWGVQGAAIATFISQSIAAFLTIRRLTKLQETYKLTAKELKIDKSNLIETLMVGIPAAIQAVAITFSNLVVQYHINSLGVDSVAAFTCYFKVEQMIYLPIMSLGQAATVFTSQNIGAGQINRLKKGLKQILCVGLLITLALSFSTLSFSSLAFGLFTSQAEVVAVGQSIASVTFPFFFLYVFIEVLTSSFRGAGHAVASMVIVICNICVIRSILLFPIMRHYFSAQGVAMVYPITWAGCALCLWLFYFISDWLPKESRPYE